MFRRRLIAALAVLAGLTAGLARAAPAGPPAPPPPTPVAETLWGVSVRDPYRGLERLDPEALDWIRREGAYARAVLDSIPRRAAFARRLAAVHALFPAVSGYQAAGGRAFFLRRAPGAGDFDLVVRDRAGERTLVDVAAIRAAEGGAYAICHVRGGGELGDAWRLAGQGPNKPNTWGDLIACGEDLIRRGIVRPGQLFILGGSAGGIAVGRAATERPDLFAGVIDAVPPANMVRLEAMPDGALETQEFGSVSSAQGLRDLLAMDTYQHVRAGVRYPPFLISMGLNDPRVAAWQPAKLAARLQTAGPTPVLLRVDLDNGRGVGSTRAQSDALYADYFAFVFRRSGRPDWQPLAVGP